MFNQEYKLLRPMPLNSLLVTVTRDYLDEKVYA